MRLLVITPGTDIAGQAYGLAQAVNRHAEGWDARAICRQRNAFDYPVDVYVPLGKRSPLVRDLIAAADVIHVMDNPVIIPDLGELGDKLVVVEHLGSRYRRNPDGVSAYCRSVGAIEVTGSLDFDGSYLPIVGDLDRFAAIRAKHYQPGKLRIAHAPTNREFKSTELILSVLARLHEYHDFEYDLIENVSWTECLERKARADILIDELRLGYGMNAIEAWGMGIPVVSGIVDEGFRSKMVEAFGSLPFLEATEDTLESRLEALIVDAGLRAEYGKRGQNHARLVHSEEVVAQRAVELYRHSRERVAA